MAAPLDAVSLDSSIRRAASTLTRPDEVVVSWVVLAATRTADDGGDVLVFPSDWALPQWQVKGMLLDALDSVRAGTLDADSGPQT